MGKSFDQFDQGEGQKYAPKPAPKPGKVAKPFKRAPQAEGPAGSSEDAIRATYRDESNLRDPRPRNQSTDHMN